MEENKTLTPEEEKMRKEKMTTRLFFLLLILCIAMVGYLVFQIVSLFS